MSKLNKKEMEYLQNMFIRWMRDADPMALQSLDRIMCKIIVMNGD